MKIIIDKTFHDLSIRLIEKIRLCDINTYSLYFNGLHPIKLSVSLNAIKKVDSIN